MFNFNNFILLLPSHGSGQCCGWILSEQLHANLIGPGGLCVMLKHTPWNIIDQTSNWMVIPFNWQQQRLKSFYPSMLPWGIPRNINLSLHTAALSFCPVKFRAPEKLAVAAVRELTFQDKAWSSVRKETLSKPGLPFITRNLFFCLLPVSHLCAERLPVIEVPCWQGQSSGLLGI